MNMPNALPLPNTRSQAITDIIESVAQVQYALGNILNAESEKIRKIISLTCSTPDDLLQANRSVEHVIGSVSRMEMILQAKLEMFEDCLCSYYPYRMDDEE